MEIWCVNSGYRSPWTYNVSLGYTIGTSLALGAEYEYQDYSTMKFRGPTGSSSEFTFENSNESYDERCEYPPSWS